MTQILTKHHQLLPKKQYFLLQSYKFTQFIFLNSDIQILISHGLLAKQLNCNKENGDVTNEASIHSKLQLRRVQVSSPFINPLLCC